MKLEKVNDTTIICIEPTTKHWHSITQSTLLIKQKRKYIKLEEAELKALERIIGGRFKQ